MDARIDRETNEGKQARPREPDGLGPIQTLFEPSRCLLVEWILPQARVQEQVGVDQDQRNSSPSAKARASLMLTT